MLETKEILDAIQKAAETIATPNCAAWLSAVASVGAVAVAIIIAIKQNGIAKKQNEIAQRQVKISEQQNGIALFEKRYEFYQMVRDCLSVAQFLLQFGNSENDIYTFFCAGRHKNLNPDSKTFKGEIRSEAIYVANTLCQAEFLFSSEICEYVEPLACSLLMLFCVNIDGFLVEGLSFEKRKENFCQAARQLKCSDTFKIIEEFLRLREE